QLVVTLECLPHGVDPVTATSGAGLVPLARRGAPHAAALDLDHDDACVGYQKNEVGLEVLLVVAQSLSGDQDVACAELVAQPLEDRVLGAAVQPWGVGLASRHNTDSAGKIVARR